MNLVKLLLYSCFLAFTTTACTPPDVMQPPDDPVDTTETDDDTEDYPIEIIWKTPLHPDTIHCLGMNPVMVGNKVIFSRWYNNYPEVIMGLNKESGEKLWEYDDLPDIISAHHTDPVIDNNLFISCEWQIFNINTDNGKLQWSTVGKFPNMYISPRFYNLNNDLHIVLFPKGHLPWDPVDYLVKLDLYTGNVTDTLVTIEERPENPAGIENVIYHQYKNGNDWILFKNRSKIADFYAYDVTGDSVVWVNYDFNNGQGVVLENPVVHEGKVIFSAGLRLLCYDLDDGSLLWEVNKPTYDVTLYRDMIICYNRDVSKPIIQSHVAAYNVENGSKIWETDVTQEADETDKFTVYNDKLYFSSPFIQCLDVNTGRKLWKFRPPDFEHGSNWDKSRYTPEMALDRETGYCYISDGFFAFCLDLNNVKIN